MVEVTDIFLVQVFLPLVYAVSVWEAKVFESWRREKEVDNKLLHPLIYHLLMI